MRSRLMLVACSVAVASLLLGCPPAPQPGPQGGGAKAPTKPEPKAGTPAKPGDPAGPAAAKPAPKETGPIAVVNGEEIPRAEFDEMYEKMTRVYTRRNKPVPENVARRHKQNIVNRLVEKRLLQQAIRKAGVAVTPAELEEGVTKYKEMFRTEENFQRYLRSSNTTLERIQDNIRFNRALDKLLEQDGPIAVTEAEMKEYYERNKRRYEVKEMVKAGHILIRLKKDASEEEKKAALKKAQDIESEARKKGADFKQLAIKHSEGPTGPKGGDLGFFTRGRMAPEFEKAAFAMKPGATSKPVLTQFGYHVIKVYERKEAGQKSFADVRESIDKLLVSRAKRKRKAELLRELKKGATIVSNLRLPPPSPTEPPAAGGAIKAGATPPEPGQPSGIKLVPGSAGGTLRLKPSLVKPGQPAGGARIVPAKPAVVPAKPAAAPAPAAQ